MRRAGFTLIELLVVIAIIAILAAILFPVFARARARAMQNTCLSNVKQITLGLIMYASDNDQRFPIQYGSYGQSPSWAEAVHPYIKNYQLWFCPDEKSPMYMANGFPRPSYSLSGNVSCGWYCAPVAQTLIPSPAAIVALASMQSTYDSPRLMSGGDWNYAYPRSQYGRCWERHNGGENYGFCDGHAKWMKLETIYLGSCAAGTSIPAGYQAAFDYNCQ